LLGAATSYMNVLRDTAIVNLRKNNISVLEEQLRQTRDRFQVGEVTRTDVAQAEASLAQSRSDFFAAQSNLRASVAAFRQYVGIEPKKLSPAKSVEKLLPKQLKSAVAVSQVEHPAIGSALHNVDVASYAVKVAESALYPTLSVNGSVNRALDYQGFTGQKLFSASVTGQLNVPLYQGGAEYASIRQAKEQLGQARLAADLARDQVRALVVTSWGQLETAKAQLISGQAAVTAAEIALNGIREEAKVGQRTTFDVLTAQQTLLNARVLLVTAQRDRVVASYAVLSAMGHLSAARLNLTAQLYDPTIHLNQVKNKLIGVSTPDGR
ncbi:MAG TPA: TolC family outer membrane protein, partial [Rhodoblastus sp.]|nr:TolC family outer membrane protein [Rhodoblastus sp.]